MLAERVPDLPWSPVLFADKQLCYCRRNYVSIEHANHAIGGTPCCNQACYRQALQQKLKREDMDYAFHKKAA